MSEIRLSNIAKSYGATKVIADLDLVIPHGSFTVIVGPSGCGKSTLLRLLAGLDDIDAGSILIGGRDVAHLRPADRGLAMVFQSYALYPHMTVRENIAFALKLAKMPRAEIDARIQAAASMLQLDALLDRKPKALSGGQRQRVAIGRAIVREPDAFLFDEPLSNLDASLRGQMRVELSELHKRLQATMVYVTHDQVEAMTMADQIVVLSQGRIEQIGAPLTLYHQPASLFVARFIGSPTMNVIGGAFAERFGAASLGVRPEHLVIGDGGQMIGAAEIKLIEHLGNDSIVHLAHEGAGLLTMRLVGDADLSVGQQVPIAIAPGRLHRFDAAGKPLGRD